jgi:hypothetical protein
MFSLLFNHQLLVDINKLFLSFPSLIIIKNPSIYQENPTTSHNKTKHKSCRADELQKNDNNK